MVCGLKLLTLTVDGTRLRIDRVGIAGGRDRPYYSGKHKCHGLTQVIADPASKLGVERSTVDASRCARLANFNRAKPWKRRNEARPYPFRKPLTGRILQAGHFIQVIVVKLELDRLPGSF